MEIIDIRVIQLFQTDSTAGDDDVLADGEIAAVVLAIFLAIFLLLVLLLLLLQLWT